MEAYYKVEVLVLMVDISQTGFTIVKYTPNGALDPTFGTGGIVVALYIGGYSFTDPTTSYYNSSARPGALIIQGDDKILAAASTDGLNTFPNQTFSDEYSVMRFTPLGVPDSTWGATSLTSTPGAVNLNYGSVYMQLPVANALSYVAPLNTAIIGQLPQMPVTITYSILTPPSNGALTGPNTTGQFTYTPNTGFSGTDSFTYQMMTSSGNTASNTVTITVNSTSDPIINNIDFGYYPYDSNTAVTSAFIVYLQGNVNNYVSPPAAYTFALTNSNVVRLNPANNTGFTAATGAFKYSGIVTAATAPLPPFVGQFTYTATLGSTVLTGTVSVTFITAPYAGTMAASPLCLDQTGRVVAISTFSSDFGVNAGTLNPRSDIIFRHLNSASAKPISTVIVSPTDGSTVTTTKFLLVQLNLSPILL